MGEYHNDICLIILTLYSFVSRTNPKSAADHVILGVIGYKPKEFASQMNLNLNNGFAIVRTIVDLILRETGDGDKKLVLAKDPNKPLLRLYEVPFSTFEEDDETDTALPNVEEGED